MIQVNDQECTGCGICVDVCPAEAISLVEGVATVDPEKCTQCLSCLDECPVEAITEE